MKKRLVMILACLMVILVTACGETETIEAVSQNTFSGDTVSENTTTELSTVENTTSSNGEDDDTDLTWELGEGYVASLSKFAMRENPKGKETTITIQDDQVSILGEGATCEGRRILITAGGDYVITGSSDNARIVITGGEKVHLFLNDVNLTSEDGAVIYGKDAKKLCITCMDGTENTLVDGRSHIEEEEKAVIYAKCDLFINGCGTLNVEGNYKNGIATKDDLKIYHTTVSLNAVGHAIKGNDSITIAEANVTVYGGEDGLKVEKSEKTEVVVAEEAEETEETFEQAEQKKGYLFVKDSYVYVTAEDDALAVTDAIVLEDSEVICRCYDKIVNCDGYLKGTDDIYVWR